MYIYIFLKSTIWAIFSFSSYSINSLTYLCFLFLMFPSLSYPLITTSKSSLAWKNAKRWAVLLHGEYVPCVKYYLNSLIYLKKKHANISKYFGLRLNMINSNSVTFKTISNVSIIKFRNRFGNKNCQLVYCMERLLDHHKNGFQVTSFYIRESVRSWSASIFHD